MSPWIILTVGCVCLLVAPFAAAAPPPRAVPPLEPPSVLTASEWDAWLAKRSELTGAIARLAAEIERQRQTGADTVALGRDLTRREAELSAFGVEKAPAYWQFRDTLLQRTRVLDLILADPLTGEPLPVNKDGARMVIDELYVDLGVPALNSALQTAVLGRLELSLGAAAPTPEDARLILRDGLAEYASLGGLAGSPFDELSGAKLLVLCAPKGDPLAADLAAQLYADATSWIEELQRPSIYVKWAGQVRRTLEARGVCLELDGGEDASPPPAGAPALPPALDELLRRSAWHPSDVDQAWVLALTDLTDARAQDEALRRLLVACKRVLRAGRAEPEVVAQLDARLLKLAEANKLTSIRLWQLWAEAVGSLRDRASAPLRAFVAQRLTDETRPMVKRALRAVDAALDTHETTRPAPPLPDAP